MGPKRAPVEGKGREMKISLLLGKSDRVSEFGACILIFHFLSGTEPLLDIYFILTNI